MGLHIILQNYNTTTDYDIPCVSALLTEINAITAGTKLDKNGLAWSIIRTDAGSGHLIEISANNTPYSLGEMEDIFKSLGFELSNYANDFDTYVPDTNGTILYLRPDSVAGQYPAYEMKKTAPYDSGRYGEKRDFVFDLDPNGTRQYTYTSYKFYNNSSHSQLQTIAKLYGGVLALDTTSGLGDFVFGEVVIQQATTGSYRSYQIRIYFNFDINGANWGMPDYSPGDKGFRPTGAFTKPNKPGIGGRGSTGKIDPDYKADQIFQPGRPDESAASAVGSGFLNIYKMTQAELNKVCACLYSETLLNALANLTVNPLDFIVSLMIFPCSPDAGGAEAIKLGKWQCIAGGAVTAIGTAMDGHRLTSQYKTFDFGTLAIPENWGSFLDYDQTDIELYLPFIGSVVIDPSECMNGTINVQYTVDFLTGQCVANVLCSRPSAELPNGKALSHVQAQHSYQGNCAVQIPLSAESYGAMVGNLINACCKTVTNPINGIIGVATDAVNGAYRPNVSTKGNIVANSGFCSVLYPYVRITRPITAEPESFQEVIGYPSYINTKLSQCTGICQCEDIDLEGIAGATESELNRIKQMCREGIYI